MDFRVEGLYLFLYRLTLVQLLLLHEIFLLYLQLKRILANQRGLGELGE